MLATKIPARVATISLMAASILFLAGCMASGPRALLDGDLALQRGNYAVAVEKLKKATELLPDEPRAWNLLGVAYHKTGQRELAMQAYRRAMERDRSNMVSVAHFNLGCLLLESGNAAAAADELRSFTMLSNSAPAWVKLGQAQLRQRQYDGAERSFANALKADPRNAEAYNNLGVLYQQRGRSRDAAQYVNAALQVDGKYPPGLLNSAIISHQTGVAKAVALKRYRDYLVVEPHSPNAVVVSGIIRQLETELAPPPPIVVAPPPQTNAPSPAPARTNAVVSPPTTNPAPVPPPRAYVALTNAPKTNTVAATPVTNAPPAVVVTRPPPVATNAPPKVVVTPKPVAPTPAPTPTTSAPLIAVVPPAPRTNQPPAVAPAPEPPITVVAVPPPAPVHLATNISQSPPPAESATSPAPMISDPPGTEAKKPGLLARMNPFRDKTEVARPLQGRTITISTAAPVPAVTAGPRTFPRYSYTNPSLQPAGNRTDAQPAMSRALSLAKSGKTNEALQQYEAALASDPSFADAQYNYALLLMNAGDMRGALPAWEKLLALEPDSLNARYNFALALRQADYVYDAAGELERVLEAKPAEARAHLLLGNLYSQQIGDMARARDHYRKVLELEPRNPQAPAIRFWLAAHP